MENTKIIKEVFYEHGYELNDEIIKGESNVFVIYGIDSLETMEIITEIENKFGVTFPEDATYEEITNLSYIITTIEKCLTI